MAFGVGRSCREGKARVWVCTGAIARKGWDGTGVACKGDEARESETCRGHRV